MSPGCIDIIPGSADHDEAGGSPSSAGRSNAAAEPLKLSTGKKREQLKRSERLEAEYLAESAAASRLIACLREQIAAILAKNDIALAVPMESRLKTWSSIKEKIERKQIDASKLSDIYDLVGIRIILLFHRDIKILDELIKAIFSVVSAEDTAARLGENQFGYQSNHYVVKLPDSWIEIPSYSDLGSLTAEIQVRTLAQHMWAAASHKLQYKREDSVPIQLRRTISRVSALLETVDLEFGRVLEERALYVSEIKIENKNEELNVDVLSALLSEIYPERNADETDEDGYDELLKDIRSYGVAGKIELREFLENTRQKVLKLDKEYAEGQDPDDVDEEDLGRYALGIYFTHVGLARMSFDNFWKKPRANTDK